jgi:regulator of RNase E activity RraA
MAAKTIGFRVYLNTSRPPAEIVAGFQNVPTGNVCDAMDRLGAMDYRIKPLDPTWHLHGSALTVRTRPGDNLMVWKALDIAQPGDVLVIATYGFTTTSSVGDMVATVARAKGVAGIVCDGVCRDTNGIRATGLPTFVLGSVPATSGKDGPGEIGAPVTCGGVPVHSGDIIVGDEDGVVVVPLADAPAVLERLPAIAEKEQSRLADIEAGRLIPKWVDETLTAKGCEFIEL